MRKLVTTLTLVLLTGLNSSIASERAHQKNQNTTISLREVSVAATDQSITSKNYKLQTARNQKYIRVKYRQTPVDVADPRFQYLDTSRSSFVTEAWYDKANAYMIIGLAGTYYHYCRMPREAWESFCAADSFGRHYNKFIKGRYDCRLGGVPDY
jgi:hypothetical protein